MAEPVNPGMEPVEEFKLSDEAIDDDDGFVRSRLYCVELTLLLYIVHNSANFCLPCLDGYVHKSRSRICGLRKMTSLRI